MHRNDSYWPEPDVSDEEVARRLATPEARRRAERELLYGDHHVLRRMFQNAHQIGPDMWRSNQPGPEELERWAARGIKTVINLRGISTDAWHLLERDACDRLGLDLVTFRVKSRDPMWPAMPRLMRELYERIRYPALMHCKSGADRAGIAAVLYRHFRLGEPMAEAKRQLGLKYLHFPLGKTGILDAYIDAYLRESEATDLDFVTWSETQFDPEAFKAAYKSAGLADFFVDKVLRRE